MPTQNADATSVPMPSPQYRCRFLTSEVLLPFLDENQILAAYDTSTYLSGWFQAVCNDSLPSRLYTPNKKTCIQNTRLRNEKRECPINAQCVRWTQETKTITIVKDFVQRVNGNSIGAFKYFEMPFTWVTSRSNRYWNEQQIDQRQRLSVVYTHVIRVLTSIWAFSEFQQYTTQTIHFSCQQTLYLFFEELH